MRIVGDSVFYYYGDLEDGVYEISVMYFKNENEMPSFVDRKIEILFYGTSLALPYGKLSNEDILRCVKAIRDGNYDFDSTFDHGA